MESVATQLINLARVAGLAINIKDERLPDGSISQVMHLPFPIKWLVAHRNTSGIITINIPSSQCLAIIAVEGWGINYSATSTIAVANSSDSLALSAQPLQTVVGVPSLYVFPPGKAKFTFVFTAQPGATARVQVKGFRLPKEALINLSRIATEQLSF